MELVLFDARLIAVVRLYFSADLRLHGPIRAHERRLARFLAMQVNTNRVGGGGPGARARRECRSLSVRSLMDADNGKGDKKWPETAAHSRRALRVGI